MKQGPFSGPVLSNCLITQIPRFHLNRSFSTSLISRCSMSPIEVCCTSEHFLFGDVEAALGEKIADAFQEGWIAAGTGIIKQREVAVSKS